MTSLYMLNQALTDEFSLEDEQVSYTFQVLLFQI